MHLSCLFICGNLEQSGTKQQAIFVGFIPLSSALPQVIYSMKIDIEKQWAVINHDRKWERPKQPELTRNDNPPSTVHSGRDG